MKARLWSASEFASSQERWDRLVSASAADPLFMSWEWQWHWWKHHAVVLGADLRILAFYSAAGDLIGLAPFYLRAARIRGMLPIRRIELIGIAWREPRAAFSEYLDIIVLPAQRDPVLLLLMQWLEARRDWDEIVLAGVREDSVATTLAKSHLPRMAYVREVDPAVAWCARLPERFQDYVAQLGSNTRRRLFQHRNRLLDSQVIPAGDAEVADLLGRLWAYTGQRWGGAEGGTGARDFHLEFAARMAQGGRLRLSRLVTRGQTLSILYNVVAGTTEYYLQSGFDRDLAPGLSPGYLHFGYAIERACQDGLERFDFLAGAGRHRDYKRELLTEPVKLNTYHVVRTALPRVLYSAYDALRGP